MKNRGIWWIYGLLAALILAIILVAAVVPNRTAYQYSAESTRETGYKAARMLLEAYGFEVALTESDLFEEDDRTVLWIRPLVYEYAQTEAIRRLPQWLSRGNTLIVLGDPSPLLSALREQYPEDGALVAMQKTFQEAAASPTCRMTYKKGEIHAISGADRFTNTGLRTEGNATALIGTLWEYREEPLLINQAGRSGNRPPAEQDTAVTADPLMLVPAAWKIAAVLLILLGLLGIRIRTRRFGPPLPGRIRAGRDENEDVIALGRVLQRADQLPGAFLQAYGLFLRQAGKSLHCPAEPEAVAEAWERSGKEGVQDLKKMEKLAESAENDAGRHQNKPYLKAMQAMDRLREELKK